MQPNLLTVSMMPMAPCVHPVHSDGQVPHIGLLEPFLEALVVTPLRSAAPRRGVACPDTRLLTVGRRGMAASQSHPVV